MSRSTAQSVVKLIAAAIVMLLAVGVSAITANAENCDNGIERWECSGFLRDVSPIVAVAMVLVTAALLVPAVRAVWGDFRRAPH